MFITFEGGEGVGKTTQINLLKQYLQQQGKKVVATREPGGTLIANKLRAILLEATELEDPLLEYAIIAAARRDHVISLIKPSLDAGAWVICDRFYDSSVVYQGIAKHLDLEIMGEIHKLLTNNLTPDLTILFDLEPTSAQNRINTRTGDLTHYDKKGIDFHHQIRNGFLQIAANEPRRVRVISADDSIEAIHTHVKNVLNI